MTRLRALALAAAALAILGGCGGTLNTADHPHQAQVDACARLAERAYDEGASIYEATKVFDECVARIR